MANGDRGEARKLSEIAEAEWVGRREGVLTRQHVRDAGLWLAQQWATLDPEQAR